MDIFDWSESRIIKGIMKWLKRDGVEGRTNLDSRMRTRDCTSSGNCELQMVQVDLVKCSSPTPRMIILEVLKFARAT